MLESIFVLSTGVAKHASRFKFYGKARSKLRYSRDSNTNNLSHAKIIPSTVICEI